MLLFRNNDIDLQIRIIAGAFNENREKNTSYVLCCDGTHDMLYHSIADGVNQTTEIQGITTTTYIDVVGMASNNVELAWTSGSDPVQTTVYSEHTDAVNGHTIYVKDFSINTGNQLPGQNNVDSSRLITFEALDGGRMVSDESLLIRSCGVSIINWWEYVLSIRCRGERRYPCFL